jgi:hypothetical protein
MSAALLGQRRMGKTEIFKRVVNRLFFEQDHRDPDAVVPVFYQFPEEMVDPEKSFAHNMWRTSSGTMPHSARDPDSLRVPRTSDLISLLRNIMEMSEGDSGPSSILLRVQDLTAGPYHLLPRKRPRGDCPVRSRP